MQKIKQVLKLEQKYISEQRSFYKVTSSIALASFCKEVIGNNASEALLVICCNTKNEILAYSELFKGTVNQSIASPREILQFALLNNAVRICLSHNHPSGNVTPSRNDIDFTQRIKEAGEIIGIEVLDHIIVNDLKDYYYSFREEGLLG